MEANNVVTEGVDSSSAAGRNRKRGKQPKCSLSLNLFRLKRLKVCKRIVLTIVLASFLTNLAMGEVARDVGSTVGRANQTGEDGRSGHEHSVSDVNLSLYNSSKNSDSGGKIDKGGSNSSVCSKEHRSGKVRELKGEVRQRRRREGRERGGSSREDPHDGTDRSRSSGNLCNSCLREEIRTISLEGIKKSILAKLGMSEPPNFAGRTKPKIGDQKLAALLGRRRSHQGSNGALWVTQADEFDLMQGDDPYSIIKNSEYINKNSNHRSHVNGSDSKHSQFQEGEMFLDEEDDYHIRTEKILISSQPRPSRPRIRHSPYIQYFNFSDKIRSSKVKKVVLWIYIRGRDSLNVVGDKITISIYKVLYTGKFVSGSSDAPFISTVLSDLNQNIPSGVGSWITLDYVEIKNLVFDWLRYPQNNLGIIITAEDANKTNLAVTSNSGNGTSSMPFLEVSVTDNKKHRTKRTVGLNCNESSNETRCCRYPLTVDFEDFGWDWIIAPKTYKINYCSGNCPFATLTNYPYTHIIQNTNIPGAGTCCAPRKLSSMKMIYFNHDFNVILGMLPNMVVDMCGCT